MTLGPAPSRTRSSRSANTTAETGIRRCGCAAHLEHPAQHPHRTAGRLLREVARHAACSDDLGGGARALRLLAAHRLPPRWEALRAAHPDGGRPAQELSEPCRTTPPARLGPCSSHALPGWRRDPEPLMSGTVPRCAAAAGGAAGALFGHMISREPATAGPGGRLRWPWCPAMPPSDCGSAPAPLATYEERPAEAILAAMASGSPWRPSADICVQATRPARGWLRPVARRRLPAALGRSAAARRRSRAPRPAPARARQARPGRGSTLRPSPGRWSGTAPAARAHVAARSRAPRSCPARSAALGRAAAASPLCAPG